jgi:hypothetical protein
MLHLYNHIFLVFSFSMRYFYFLLHARVLLLFYRLIFLTFACAA